MKGKVCLITGSTSGVGKAIALGLARLGAKIVMQCRDRQKGAEIADEIKHLSGNDSVDMMIADLSIQALGVE